MDNAIYTALTRQSGLMREMQAVANNIANASTTGFRREGMLFSEHIARLDGVEPSLSMATANVRVVDLSQGGMTRTGGSFDFAIDGTGFFLLQTPQGDRLTRAGSFTPNQNGELVNPDGHRLLDEGGAPIFIPTEAKQIALAADGTLSADGQPVTRIGLYRPIDPTDLNHEAGTLFRADNGVEPASGARLRQGYVEESNVNPVNEIARMIAVQRAYELGQGLLDREDQRIRGVIETLGR